MNLNAVEKQLDQRKWSNQKQNVMKFSAKER